MKIRMLVDVSGTRDGQAWPPRGEVADVTDDEGAGLCAAGIAKPVADSDSDVETRTLTTESAAEVTPSAPGGLYDPTQHAMPDVLAYLAAADEAEVLRVLAVEESGKGRAGIVGKSGELLARFGEAG